MRSERNITLQKYFNFKPPSYHRLLSGNALTDSELGVVVDALRRLPRLRCLDVGDNEGVIDRRAVHRRVGGFVHVHFGAERIECVHYDSSARSK